MDAMIARVLRREGSEYTDTPGDRGGPTKFGITLETLRLARKDPSLGAADVRALAEAQAAAIYERLYLEKPGISQVAGAALTELLFDSAVQHGPPSALADGRFYCIGWLQAAVGAAEDRVIGPQTLAKVKAADPRATFAAVYTHRLQFYAGIVVHDTTQAEFLEGWMARMGELLGDCLSDGGL